MRFPPLLLDAGPLLTYLAVCFFRDDKTPNAKRLAVLRDLRQNDKDPFDQERQERLLLIFERCNLATTSHVLAETLKFRDHSELKSLEASFRNFSITFLANNVDDFACPISRLDHDPSIRDLAVQFGVADAGLAMIAHEHGSLLLTDDRRLFQRLAVDSRFEIEMFQQFLDSGY